MLGDIKKKGQNRTLALTMRVIGGRILNVMKSISLVVGGSKLRCLISLAAMLVMVLVASGPAVAQAEQESEQEGESGEVGQSFEVSSSGGSANQCAEILAAAQSGNAQNVADGTEAGSEADEFEFEDGGFSIEVSPELAEACEQTINQAASAAGRAEEKKAATAPAPRTAPTLAPKSEAKKEEAKKEEAKKDGAKKEKTKKELPKTGGSGAASLLALGGGALLVTGGLLVRRIVR
jgi:LPXTG-motif cell wall-anchored protein